MHRASSPARIGCGDPLRGRGIRDYPARDRHDGSAGGGGKSPLSGGGEPQISPTDDGKPWNRGLEGGTGPSAGAGGHSGPGVVSGQGSGEAPDRDLRGLVGGGRTFDGRI